MEQVPSPRMHPAMIVAAVSVTALSLVGIGVLTGVIPGRTDPPSVAAPATTPTAALPSAAPAATVSVQVNPTPPAPVVRTATPKPVARVIERRTTDVVEVVRSEPAAHGRNDYRRAPAIVCHECGTIESVQEFVQEDSGPGLGTVAGGVIGGVLGNQVGKGSGKDLATMAGIVGGAIAGHQIEKGQKKIRYDVIVRMDNGGTRTVSSHVQPVWRPGERVKINDGVLMTPDSTYR